MTPESCLPFVAGSVLLVVSPGPDMAYLLARCLAHHLTRLTGAVFNAIGVQVGLS